MQFNHYSDEGAVLAADLVNARFGGRLETPAHVEHLARDHDLLLDVPPTVADVTGLRDWADALAGVVDAAPGPARISALNGLLERGTSHPRITEHDGRPPHLHFRDDGAPPTRQIAAITGFGLSWFLTQRGMHRFARCAADQCDLAFADVSRNGRQRFCSARCANREAVRRHRARTSARP